MGWFAPGYSFVRLLTAATVGLVLASTMLVAAISLYVTHRTAEVCVEMIANEALGGLSRQAQLVAEAVGHYEQSALRASGARFAPARRMADLHAAWRGEFRANGLLSHVGFGDLETGGYCLLRRRGPAELEAVEWRPGGAAGGEVLEYRSDAAGLTLLRRLPWDRFDFRRQESVARTLASGRAGWFADLPRWRPEDGSAPSGPACLIPVSGVPGRCEALVEVGLDPRVLSSGLNDLKTGSPVRTLWLAERPGGGLGVVAQAAPGPGEVADDLTTVAGPMLSPSGRAAVAGLPSSGAREMKVAGQRQLVVWRRYTGRAWPAWTAVALVPQAAVTGPLRWLRGGSVAASLGCVAVSALAAAALARRAARPLRQLRAGTEAVAGGRYDEPIQPSGPKEFRELAQAFNDMAESVLSRRMELLAANAALRDEVASRQTAEAALREREEFFRLIAENVADLIAVVDREGRRLYNSPSYRRILGDTAKLEGTDSFLEIHPDDVPRVRDVFRRTVETGVGQCAEFRFLLPGGRVYYVESRGAVIRDALGQTERVVIVSRDITDRRQTEAALRESERKYRELVENANSIILRWNRRGIITFLNEFGQRFFGYAEPEVVGQHIVGTLVPEVDTEGRDLRQLLERISGDPDAFALNINENMRHDGSRVWVEWTNKAVFSPDGQLAEVFSVGSDITQRKQAEDALQRAHAELEQRVEERTAALTAANERLRDLDRLKSEFLATMSHELRTPLNSIIGFTGIVKAGMAGSLNPEQKKQLDMAYASAKHLLGLINDLLDLSRIESGRVDVDWQEFRPADVLREVEQTLSPMFAAKGLRFERVCERPETALCGDRKRFYQVALNLANNAVKFTEHGEVRITGGIEDGRYVVAVADTGIGIRPEHMSMLFEAFRQVDGSARRVYEGTGLGLYLCRRILGLLGGGIRAESEYGRGSRFVFWVPTNAVPPA